MEITIKGTTKVRAVPDALARVLIGKGLAYETRQVTPEPATEPEKISTRTGKPTRQYRRRDMKAED